uniref:ATP synthase complex subunit 8 n=1 Tax=Mecistops cataphractus TaxID=184780 RepID=B2WVK1_9SAUR|nr:ATP synthase F0 subunit 8 [Mecistops cataphractus]ABP62973.1 ATP synthase F0 subunit 8 [Mecistops cataphractus]QOI74188.1 ATP synthase F0 subunit 8 [Mecistops cataphractus]
MPQLNPEPWLMVLSVTWLVLIIILQPKIASLKFTNNPTNPDQKTTKAWPWPQT